jgi:hypothetical protein
MSEPETESSAPSPRALTLMNLVEHHLQRTIADLILAEARVNRAAEQMASLSREFAEGVELMFHVFSSLAAALDAGGQHEAAATVRAVLASYHSASSRKRKRDDGSSPGGSDED